MTRRPFAPRLALAAALALPGTLAALTGCHNDANSPAGQSAEQAVGVKPGSTSTKTVDMKRDVIVEEEKKVFDARTGQVLSDRKTDTPVTIIQSKEVTTDVKVNVGDEKKTGK
jgi:hypothetical protein